MQGGAADGAAGPAPVGIMKRRRQASSRSEGGGSTPAELPAIRFDISQSGSTTSLSLPNSARLKSYSTTFVTRPGPQSGTAYPLQLTANNLMVNESGLLDFRNLELKEESDRYPLLVCPNAYIFYETECIDQALAEEAGQFLISVAEPVSRPEMVHEFQITVFSLYAALSMGLALDEILAKLDFYSKNKLNPELVEEIRKHGSSFGKVKLVLRNSKYHVESPHRSELEFLVSNPVIASARLKCSLALRQIRSGGENLDPDWSSTNTMCAGFSTVQLSGMFFAADIAPPTRKPRSFMYFAISLKMRLFGMTKARTHPKTNYETSLACTGPTLSPPQPRPP